MLLHIPHGPRRLPLPAILKPKPLWTGKQLLSLVLPKDLHINREEATSMVVEDTGIVVREGEILQGVLDLNTVGPARNGVGSLMHTLLLCDSGTDQGTTQCLAILETFQTLANYWLSHRSFSCGIGDFLLGANGVKDVKQNILDGLAGAQRVAEDSRRGNIRPHLGETHEERVERDSVSIFLGTKEKVAWSVKSGLMARNYIAGLLSTVEREGWSNIARMSACLGQQLVDGRPTRHFLDINKPQGFPSYPRRIPLGFQNRSLPHFVKFDPDPASMGFIRNSYLSGLNPQEMFFQAIEGRSDMVRPLAHDIDRASIRRQLMQALEDVTVAYDGTARDSSGQLLQFVYGDDGMDGRYVETQNVVLEDLEDVTFERRYRVVGRGRGPTQAVLEEEFQRLVQDREDLKRFILERSRNDIWTGTGTVHVRVQQPVNLHHILDQARVKFDLLPKTWSARRTTETVNDLAPSYIVESVSQLVDELSKDLMTADDLISQEKRRDAMALFGIRIRALLTTRRVLEEFRLTRVAFDWILREIRRAFRMALVQPGEACGALAALAIAQHATAPLMPVVPRPGVSPTTVLLGVPRLKELLDAKADIATPLITVYFTDAAQHDVSLAKAVTLSLRCVMLSDLVSSVQVHYDPELLGTTIDEDKEWVDAYFAIPDEDEEADFQHHSQWLLRFELNRTKVLDRRLQMADIAKRISASLVESNRKAFVIWSEDNAETLVIRCRLIRRPGEPEVDRNGLKGVPSGEVDAFCQLGQDLLDKVHLQGVPGVQQAMLLEYSGLTVSPNGNTYQHDREWISEAEGTNFKSVLGVDGVDAHRTHTNDCMATLHVLGVEAARTVLLRQFRDVVEWDGTQIDRRHLALLCDYMTFGGSIAPIRPRTTFGRHQEQSILTLSAFCEDPDPLYGAAVGGRIDGVKNAAMRSMFGQQIAIGTGSVQMLTA